jgi:hypothetical protein
MGLCLVTFAINRDLLNVTIDPGFFVTFDFSDKGFRSRMHLIPPYS